MLTSGHVTEVVPQNLLIFKLACVVVRILLARAGSVPGRAWVGLRSGRVGHGSGWVGRGSGRVGPGSGMGRAWVGAGRAWVGLGRARSRFASC